MFGFRHVLFFCMAIASMPARAEIATVGYLHDYINQRWGITIPHSAGDTGIPNMTYLMRMVDAANEILNGTRISDYANNSQYATRSIVATPSANDAVDNLIRKLDMEFWVVPDTSGNTFVINIAAGGMFLIAWGDGEVQRIDKAAGPQDYSHTFPTGANNYKIYIGGDATGYPTTDNAAIWFGGNIANRKVREVGGCLGCVFHTVGDGTTERQQPKFHETFGSNSTLTSIPDGFFYGVRGSNGRRMFYQTFKNSGLTELPDNLFMGNELVPASHMFYETFYGCGNLAGPIPVNLFSGLVGAPSDYMFDNTFHDCKSLDGDIPESLFGGISGKPATKMFNGTFYGCGRLTGEIPSGLFRDISGEPRPSMFEHTFSGCSSLTSIGDGLFGDISGGAQAQMFDSTFNGCSSLTGPSATVGTGENKEFLYQRWPNVVGLQAERCYIGATNLDDYNCIPENWGGPGTKAPGTCMACPPECERVDPEIE